ncbi:MAG TPA: efflux RND transporter periplasmic adaptor subunit, partial [Flavisolibacter sp.]|nr:efflux RND transporter periplasmic adaptor subunit [Flavisolibacter sp.]
LTAFESVDIFPKVSGFLKEVYVDRGSLVQKGQILMTLEAPELNQQVQTARANVNKAKELYSISKERYERLLQTSKTPGTVSPFDLSSALAKMQSDAAALAAEESNVKSLSEVLGYLTVRAPFNGMITERNIHPGALVGPNTKTAGDRPMLSLQQLDHLRLTVHVPEAVASVMEQKGKVAFTLSAFPGQEFTASLSRQSGVISSNMRSEAVELDVPSQGGKIKPGMYAEVRLPITAARNGFVIPSSAIVHSTKGVYLVGLDENGKTRFFPVEEGINSGDSTEVFGTLTSGMKVFAHPSSDMEEGVKAGS